MSELIEAQQKIGNSQAVSHNEATASVVTVSNETTGAVAPCFYSWQGLYPELQILLDNIEIIKEEVDAVKGTFVPWPEDHFTLGDDVENSKEWNVYPLLHTFPAYDPDCKKWIPATCEKCPRTTALLKQLQPLIRTALFSRLGPGTKLSSHTGWADLANYVLRCHLCLDIPTDGTCGLLVDGQIGYHRKNHIVVFDDSKPHRAFNNSMSCDRTVLIIDMWRPIDIPKGTATGSHTPELDGFVARFK
mmetsp:Transcript_32183/g.54281  ORF Transcript_32183/g.54281 Transcript_32183/m.54281 type:complete len:246 (+) Transcript_32183:72-809(+)